MRTLMVVALLALSACAPAQEGPSVPAAPSASAPASTATPAPRATAEPRPSGVLPSAQRPAPVSVTVPALGLDRGLIDLGLRDDGTMEVPSDYDDVGWYTPGGRPGGPGPVVLAGHVDSATGPAVFYDLSDLTPGDQVTVGLADGRAVQYRVTRTETYPKDAFPTGEVFGATVTDELRLITCGGDFDESVSSYRDNTVVYAEAV